MIGQDIKKYTFTNDKFALVETAKYTSQSVVLQINTNDSYYVYVKSTQGQIQKYNLSDLEDVTQVNIPGEPLGYLVHHGLYFKTQGDAGIETESGKTFSVDSNSNGNVTETKDHFIFSQKSPVKLYVFDPSGKHT